MEDKHQEMAEAPEYNLVNRFLVVFPNEELPTDCVYDVSELVLIKGVEQIAPLYISFVSKESANIEKKLIDLVQNSTEDLIDINITMLTPENKEHIKYVIKAKIERVVFSPFTYAEPAPAIHQLVILPEKVDIA